MISNPFQRSNTGGKPALVINMEKFVIDDPNQTLINIPWGVEIVWSILTPKKVLSSSKIKKIIAASFYCKPGSRKKKVLLDHICEVYHFLSSKFQDSYWLIGADKNDLKIDAILHLNQNFKQCVDVPTRDNPPAIIDILITDLHMYYQTPISENPLEVDKDKAGSSSDHFMILIEPINAISNKKTHEKRTFNYRAYTDQAFANMDNALENVKWDEILENTKGDQIHTFHKLLYDIFEKCFPLKSKTVFTEKEPFFTEKLSKLKRRKCREYNKNRKSEKYLSILRIYKKELSLARKSYYRKKLRKLRSTNPRQWFKWVKGFGNSEQIDEKLEVESIKHLSDIEQAELIADKFANVSNEYQPLDTI